MSGIISGNMVGGAAPLKTLIITDADGNEFTGIVTGNEVIFTATDNDVREGMVYASDGGVSTGTKDIPIYRTSAGMKMVAPNEAFSLFIPEYDSYDYTVFQCMISLVNSDNIDNSVNTVMVALNNGVYNVNSITLVSNVSKDVETQSINLNINNNSDNYYIIHYFTYREEE